MYGTIYIRPNATTIIICTSTAVEYIDSSKRFTIRIFFMVRNIICIPLGYSELSIFHCNNNNYTDLCTLTKNEICKAKYSRKLNVSTVSKFNYFCSLRRITIFCTENCILFSTHLYYLYDSWMT